jgi:hypothetical protein
MAAGELHIELLLGRQVVAGNGDPVGRVEEVCAEGRGSDLIVTEYHIGNAAALERLSVSLLGLGILNLFGRAQATRGYRVPWDKLDLTDQRHPRLMCAVADLVPLRWSDSAGASGRSQMGTSETTCEE